MTNITTPLPERSGALELDDGRLLAWGAWGPPDGILVLLHHGAGMGHQMGMATPELLDEVGLQIVAVDRPGIGGSTHDPVRDHASFAADLRSLLAHHGTDQAPMIGYSQGAVFATAAAGAGLASQLVIVAGQDDLTDLARRGLLPAPIADMARVVAADPDTTERNFASIATAASLLETVTSSCSAHDQAFFTEPTFADAYERCLVEGFRRGAHGYARDLRLALQPWPTPPEDIEVPVELWYGALDTIPVHSPDQGVHLASRFPHATHHLVDDAGGSVLWREADAILRRLREVAHTLDT